nr:alpha/beta hydrolase [Ectobacillus ponti]
MLRGQEEVKSVNQAVHYVKQEDLAYGRASGKQKLDLYLPEKRTERMPVVIHLHGGGWGGGSKQNVSAKPAFFTGNGYVFISANYRLHPDASYEEMVQDAATVIKWVYENADQYGMDQTRINMMGHSAGGHLAGLLAANPVYLQQAGLPADAIHSLVVLDGPLDLVSFVRMLPTYKEVFGDKEADLKQASPITYLRSNAQRAPIFIATRRKNPVYQQLAETAQKQGNEIDVYDKIGSLSHSEVNTLLGDNAASREAKEMSKAVLAFLNQHNR